MTEIRLDASSPASEVSPVFTVFKLRLYSGYKAENVMVLEVAQVSVHSSSIKDTKDYFFKMRVLKTLAQVAQKGDRCPIPGNIRALRHLI